jgi:putative transposase
MPLSPRSPDFFQVFSTNQPLLDKLANSLYPGKMDTTIAERRLKALDFWEKHGTAPTRNAFGVGRTTLYRWKREYEASGASLRSLAPKSRARRENHQRTVDWRVKAEIVRLRTGHPRLGKEKLLPLLRAFCRREGIPESLSESRVGRILADLRKSGRLPVPGKVRIRATSGKLHLKNRTPGKRKLRRSGYRPGLPGDLVQIDTVITFIDGIRRYTVTAVDVTSRFAFAWSYNSGSSASARDFFQRLELVAPFPVKRVQTDNGSEFLQLFQGHLESAGVTHFFNYPRRPQWNGHVERFNRTIQDEFLSWHTQTLADDVAEFNRLCCEWLLWYNGERHHHALKASPLGHLEGIRIGL